MIELLKSFFIDLNEKKVLNLVMRCLKANYSRLQILNALDEALLIVGEKFNSGEYTLSDLMMSGIIYEEIINLDALSITNEIKGRLSDGTILLGTVESDIHDIGKSLFKNAAIKAGFNVIDLGVNISSGYFCQKINTIKPDIIGISVILTNALGYLTSTISEIKEKSTVENMKILVGSNLLDKEILETVGADAYTNNAVLGVEICENWVSKK
ncbi:MAG: cobalamin B12-binding domain-containing protein [Eubacteriaceae bacterium]